MMLPKTNPLLNSIFRFHVIFQGAFPFSHDCQISTTNSRFDTQNPAPFAMKNFKNNLDTISSGPLIGFLPNEFYVLTLALDDKGHLIKKHLEHFF